MAYCPKHTLPPHFNCADIPHRVIVHAIGSGTHCHSVVPGGLADPSIASAGVLDAIDIWGGNSTVRFCFLKPGRLVFIDTSASPRVTSNLAADYNNGMTCGTVDRTGMVALLRADETAVVSPDPPTAPVKPETATVSSDDCQVTTTAVLSLRAGPSVFYARLDAMPLGTRLHVSGRNGDWFLVNYLGQWGWSSSAHLTQSGACDAVEKSSRVYLPQGEDPTPEAGETQAETQEPAQPAPALPSQFELIDCRLTAGDIINLRAKPGTEHNILAEIPFRTQLTALDRSGDWFQVEFGGNTGWVNIEYVFRRGACS